MSKLLDRAVPQPGSEGYHRGVTPRDAASLVLVRFDDGGPRVLMGQRHTNMRFMPGKLVFPGGSVDASDHRARFGVTLDGRVEDALQYEMRGRASPTRARALALAAIRETFEETGNLVARAGSAAAKVSAPWTAFTDRQLEPALGSLHFIARAITPPGLAKRFDTRFFLADAECIAGTVDAPDPNELLDADWLTFSEARARDHAPITGMVLDIVEERLDGLAAGSIRGSIPFFSARRGKRVLTRIPLRA